MWFRNEAIIIGTPVEPVQHSLQASLEVACGVHQRHRRARVTVQNRKHQQRGERDRAVHAAQQQASPSGKNHPTHFST